MDCEAEWPLGGIVIDHHGLEMFEQRGPPIPGHVVGGGHDIVALEGRDGNTERVGNADAIREVEIVGADLFEALLVVADEIHLVDRSDDVVDTEQRDQETVSAGLGQHPGSGIDQDDGEVRSRRAGDHIAGVLLMARGVGNDEGPPVGGEVAMGDIDGDPLFAFGCQPIGEKREIEAITLGADTCRVSGQRGEMVVEDQV